MTIHDPPEPANARRGGAIVPQRHAEYEIRIALVRDEKIRLRRSWLTTAQLDAVLPRAEGERW